MKLLYRALTACLLLASATALAEAGVSVVRVGSESADALAVARSLLRIPAFQLAELGTDDATRRRHVVEKFLVPELQGAAEARARGLDKRPQAADRMRELYSRAMDAELSRLVATEHPVTDADIQKYFDEHRERFEAPRRVRIWRIAVDNEELAKKIILEAQGAGGPARWRNLAREHSLDLATKLRDGDLGFVGPDGTTETPTLRVDPALFEAVDQLSDGQLLPRPLKLPTGISVLWRRGSLPALARTVAQEAPAIRTLLARERLEQARQNLLTDLRKQGLAAFDAELLETLPDAIFAPPAASAGATPVPSLPSAQPAPAGAVTPQPGERGTR